MSKSRPWSSASAPCRLEWKPSRTLGLALVLLAMLAAVSVVASELPLMVSLPLAAVSMAYGAWLARREILRPLCRLVIPANDNDATIDGAAMHGLQLQWRGRMAFVQWRDADDRRQQLTGWADNLDASARRELRLAMAARAPDRSPRSMAP